MSKVTVIYSSENLSKEITKALRSMDVIIPRDVKEIQKSSIYQNEEVKISNQVVKINSHQKLIRTNKVFCYLFLIFYVV